MKRDNEYVYYYGYYHGICYGVSHKKDLLHIYFQDYRGLHKYDYEITQYPDRYHFVDPDDDQYLINWENHYIPKIDVEMIDYYGIPLNQEILNTLQNLQRLLGTAEGTNIFDDNETSNLLRSCEILSNVLTHPKRYRKLEKEDRIYNSILYTPMQEYVQIVAEYKWRKLRYANEEI